MLLLIIISGVLIGNWSKAGGKFRVKMYIIIFDDFQSREKFKLLKLTIRNGKIIFVRK